MPESLLASQIPRARGSLWWGTTMPLSGTAYDPDTLAVLYRALNAALHRAVPDVVALDEVSRQSIREKLARALIRAYEDGERDSELLAIIAVQSYKRDT
jgi:hypothetical protein